MGLKSKKDPDNEAIHSMVSVAVTATADDESAKCYRDFEPQVRKILRRYRKKRQLSALAATVGINQTRLAEMINKNSKGQYKRRITPYYLSKFLDKGIITVEELLEGRSIEDFPDRVGIFFERHILSRKTIRLIVEAQKRGFDIDSLLQLILFPNGDVPK